MIMQTFAKSDKGEMIMSLIDKFKETHLKTQTQNAVEPMSRINTRIEAVDDPKINKALFSIYEKLIEPFKKIEAKVARINNLQELIEENKEYTKCSFSRILYFSKYIFFPLLIINIIIVSINMDNEIFLRKFLPLEALFEFLIDNYDTTFLDLLYFAYCFLFHPIFLSFFIIGIIVITVNIIHKFQNEKYQKEIDELMPIVNSEMEDISEVACFIPPNYRYSDALNFFVDSYANSKVDNLKEAVNLYDTNEYRQNMLDYQAEMVEWTRAIAFAELEQAEQLKNIRNDIWLSEILF